MTFRDDPGTTSTGARGAPLSTAARMLLPPVLVLVVALLALPGPGVRALAGEWPLLAAAVRWLGRLYPGIDMFHALLFAMTALLASLAYPDTGSRRLLLVLFVLAAFTEYVQIWIPGRSSSLVELGVDVAGAAVGIALGHCFGRMPARASG